jgi:hypothetical protein
MDARLINFAERFIRYWRQLSIILLAFTVFALGLHAKLSLYKPASPTILLTITKLSASDRFAKAILPSQKRLIRTKVIEAAAAFFFTFRPVKAGLQHDRQRGFAPTGFLLRHHHSFLFFRPPPSPSFA